MIKSQDRDSAPTDVPPRPAVRVLGPLMVVSAGDEIQIGPRLRRLLAALVVVRGESVSVDRLADVVWGGDPPAGAERTLPSYVTRLRQTLGAGTDVLRYREPGYSLDVDAVDVDADRFELEVDHAGQHLRAADPAAALTSIDAALALWRGTAYSGLEHDEWFRPEAVRLERRRHEALLLRAEALLAIGDHEHAVAEAEALATVAPLSDAPRILLMRALYASGDQAAALRVLPAYRSTLVDEVGLDPSSEILEVDARIARGERGVASAVLLRGYEVHERIGEGAFAVVHRGLQPGVDREVAIKIIRSDLADRADFILRFDHEAHLAARLEHPHIVPLYDYWRVPGAAYLVMRLLRGGTVEEALRRGGPLSLDRTLQIVDEIAAALTVAHRAGVVHRDVKPANVLLDDDGHAYLADFGIATAVRAIDSVNLESPSYAAPEQLRHQPVGPAADVLSFAISVFEMLTGRLPFADSQSRAELVRRQLESPIPPVTATRTDLPVEIDEVLARATAKAEADRHQTVAAFAADLAAAVGASARADARRPVRTVAPANPYVGLHAFDEADAARFHGRGALVADLADRVAASRFVTVVGPSGTGKSSIVRAGLLPSLRLGAVAGSESWFITTMLPGSDPFDAFEDALLHVAVNPPTTLRDQLDEPGGLERTVRRVLPTEDAQVLVVIDQFEELFTQADPEVAHRFLSELGAALDRPACPLRIVATLRADHFDRPLEHRVIASYVTEGLVPIVPMTADEIERAIVEPARAVDVEVEPALVAELGAAATDRPASLPMLQFCLSEAFDRRVGDVMMLSGYRESGGLSGAVAARAERAVLAGDDSAEEERAARRLFERLVSVGDDGEARRRRARRSDVLVDERTAWIVDALTKARLLSTGIDPVGREPTIEIAHESLLREWPRLRDWIEEDRADLAVLRRLGGAAAAWERSGGDAGELARGGRLETALEFRMRRADLLSRTEQSWIDESVAARTAADGERERRSRRLRRITVVAVAFAAVAVGATFVALGQRNDADRRAQELQVQRLTAASVAAQDDDPDLAILLALAAYDDGAALGEVPGDVVGALHAAAQSSRLIARFDGGGGVVALHPDGRTAVYGSIGPPFELTVVDVDSGQVQSQHRVDRQPAELAFTPDGDAVAVAYAEGDPGAGATTDDQVVLEVLDLETWSQVAAYAAPCCVDGLHFSGEGRRLAAEVHPPGTDGPYLADTVVLDLDDPAGPPSIHAGYELGGWVSGDTALARFRISEPSIEVVDPITQEQLGPGVTAPDLVIDVAVDGSGSRIAFVTPVGVEVRDVTGTVVADIPIHVDRSTSYRDDILLSSDGRSVVWFGFGTGLTVTDVESGRSMVLAAGRTDHRSMSLSDDGTRLASATPREVTVWDVSRSGPDDLGAIPVPDDRVDVSIGDDSGSMIVVTEVGGNVGLHPFDLTSGREATLDGNEHGRIAMQFAGVWSGLGLCDRYEDASARWMLVGRSFDPADPDRCESIATRIYDLDGGVVAELPDRANYARLGRTGTPSGELVAWTDERQAGLFDVRAERVIGSLDGEGFDVGRPTFSPDGSLLAVGSLNDGAYVIDVEQVIDGTPMADAVVLHVEYDGTTVDPAVVVSDILVAAHDSTEFVVWDLRTGRRRMSMPSGAGRDLIATPDGRYVYYQAADEVMRRLPVDIDEIVDLAGRRVQRGFTDDECASFFSDRDCPTGG